MADSLPESGTVAEAFKKSSAATVRRDAVAGQVLAGLKDLKTNYSTPAYSEYRKRPGARVLGNDRNNAGAYGWYDRFYYAETKPSIGTDLSSVENGHSRRITTSVKVGDSPLEIQVNPNGSVQWGAGDGKGGFKGEVHAGTANACIEAITNCARSQGQVMETPKKERTGPILGKGQPGGAGIH